MQRCVILQLAFAVTLFSKVTFAKELLDLYDNGKTFPNVGIPTFSPSEDNYGNCLKDILIIVDASKSVGKENFEKVKKFLRDIVSKQNLDISPEGTNVAFMVFSSEDTTKILQDFDHDHDKLSLNSTIERYEWNEKGYTRTDIALQKANQMFKERSPLNHRDQYDDVILLITDGEPHDKQLNNTNVIEATKTEAKLLKDKGVTIVGVGIGDELNMKTLEDISGPVPPINAESFDALPTIKEQLVAESCVRPAVVETKCTCNDTRLSDQIFKTRKSTKVVRWSVTPKPTCPNNSNPKLIEDRNRSKSGDTFAAGQYTIKYKYKTKIGDQPTVTCKISFKVDKKSTTQKPTIPTSAEVNSTTDLQKPTDASTTTKGSSETVIAALLIICRLLV